MRSTDRVFAVGRWRKKSKELKLEMGVVRLSAPTIKDIPVFQASCIRLLSPMEQEIADTLQKAGYIRIIDAPAPGRDAR